MGLEQTRFVFLVTEFFDIISALEGKGNPRRTAKMGNACNSTDKDVEGKANKIQQGANG